MFKKLLVPIDVFSEKNGSAQQALRAALSLIALDSPEMLAVNVVTPKGVGVSLRDFPQKMDYYRGIAKATLESLSLDVPASMKVWTEVIPSGVESTQAAVKMILDTALVASCDLIALSTHARRGIDRLFLGSFAETLLHLSTIPVLTINPRCSAPKSYKRILFPIDMATIEGSQWLYASTLAQFLELPVTLIHHHRTPIPFIPIPGIAPMPFLEIDHKEAMSRAESVRNKMRDAGVDTNLEFVCDGLSTSSVITEVAERQAESLILMLTHLGAKGRSGIGSKTRQVVRESVCPVLSVPRGE